MNIKILLLKKYFQSLQIQESYERRIINNIYFDDLGQNSARDNINGNSMSKFRLRWYGEKYGKIKSILKENKKGNVGGKIFMKLKILYFQKIQIGCRSGIKQKKIVKIFYARNQLNISMLYY